MEILPEIKNEVIGFEQNSLVRSEAELWLANFTSKQTQKTYRDGLLQFISFFNLSSWSDFSEITPHHIVHWRDALINAGQSERTVHNRLAMLSSLYKSLFNKQLVSSNPVTTIKRPKVNNRKVKTPGLTVEQVRQILSIPNRSTVKGLRDHAILSTLFYSGCREGALVKLKVGDFYESSGYMVLELHEKGGKENTIAIHHELQASLRHYLSIYKFAHKLDFPLFTAINTRSPLPSPLSTRMIRYLFKAYLLRAGIANLERYSVHSARTTFATEALRNSAKVEHVQQTLGHSNVSTTLMYDTRNTEPKNSASFMVNF